MAEEASGRPVMAGRPRVGIPPLGVWGLGGRNTKGQVGSEGGPCGFLRGDWRGSRCVRYQ